MGGVGDDDLAHLSSVLAQHKQDTAMGSITSIIGRVVSSSNLPLVAAPHDNATAAQQLQCVHPYTPCLAAAAAAVAVAVAVAAAAAAAFRCCTMLTLLWPCSSLPTGCCGSGWQKIGCDIHSAS
jgi:hypothetical protein